MSYQIGLETINLKPTERLAHTEYCDHTPLIQKVCNECNCSFEDAWDMDFRWHIDDGPGLWSERGRVTDMGHAEFSEGGLDKRDPQPSPFTNPEQVLAFDAVREYGLPDMDELISYYEKSYRQLRISYPNQVVPGGYYKTLVSGAIASFGWDMLLIAAADQNRFERVLDSFFQLSLHHCQAWAKTSIEVFICHDDMVWSNGAFMDPDFYRQAIIPRYRELWTILKRAGKKVLYCSDGNWIEFDDDIADAGADGFIFEPFVPLKTIVKKYGGTHVIVGSNVDCRTLTFGTRVEIQAEIDTTLELAFKCPGFIFATGNHIPSNVPVDNAVFYFDYLKAHWTRP